MLDDRENVFGTDNIDLVTRMCSRRFGIGADGLILIKGHETLDFHMVYFNADGSQSFCGNGSRCAVVFAKFLGMIDSSCKFLSTDGEHEAEIIGELVRLKMNDVSSVEVGDNHFFVNTGSPHWIEVKEEIDNVDAYNEARKIRYNERFDAEGTNVNYMEFVNGGIRIRTYERGVEDITLACGTGVTACALVASETLASPVSVKADGGDLSVAFEGNMDTGFTEIWLTGPAEYVFKGIWKV